MPLEATMIPLLPARRRHFLPSLLLLLRSFSSSHRRAKTKATSPPKAPNVSKPKPPPPPPPSPPTPPPQRPAPFSLHGLHWHDPYSWMSSLSDRAAMRHLDAFLSQEDRYLDAVMAPTSRLQSKLQSEMSVRMAPDLCSPPLRWGPWLYYRRADDGRPHPILCRRSVALNDEFLSYTTPFAGFDFDSGKRIEQVMLDYNHEAANSGGCTFEDRSEVSPDHRYLAYTMYDKDKEGCTLFVKDLFKGTVCEKPRADRVAQLSWAMGGKALLYTVRGTGMRPYKIFLSFVGSNNDDVLIFEEPDEKIYVNIRSTKDYQFITVNNCSNASTKVYLINGNDPLSGLTLVWESEERADCIIEHHRGWLYLFTNASRGGLSPDSHYLLRRAVRGLHTRWETVVEEDPGISIEDVDFCESHMVVVLREGKDYRICSIALPLPVGEGPMLMNNLRSSFLPLPQNVCQISAGPNYDYYSSMMRFTISSPVMPDAVVDYNLLNGKWHIVQQQNFLLERTRTLYGTSALKDKNKAIYAQSSEAGLTDNPWNALSEFYACDHYDVSSEDGVLVPLTVVYARKKLEGSPGLLHGHGAYGEILDKRWRSELKSLLDRGWVIAYADVRGGGGKGKKWHIDGKCTLKQNSIADYISCAEFLIRRNIVEETKLAGWGYSAGGLLVASAINARPDLFRAAVLKVPFLDPCGTLLNPILPLDPMDYEEFGSPQNKEDFLAMKSYSPYENIQKGVLYPAVLVTPSFNTRFGVWEAAKWVAKVRELTVHDPEHPILLNITMDMLEDNKYMESKELALEAAFLIKTVVGSWG